MNDVVVAVRRMSGGYLVFYLRRKKDVPYLIRLIRILGALLLSVCFCAAVSSFRGDYYREEISTKVSSYL